MSVRSEGARDPFHHRIDLTILGVEERQDSVGLTGRGKGRLVVLMTDAPVGRDAIRRATAAACRKAGSDLAKLPPLGLPGEEFHRTFLKP